MADNINVTPGVGATIAAENIGGALVQRVKLSIGDYDVDDGDISSSNPMPMTVSSLPLPSGAATAANQATEIASLASIDSKLTSPLTVTGPLTDAQLRATPVPVSGTLAVTQSGTWNITNISGTVSLPTGASTSALQTTGNTSLSTIATALTLAQGSTTSGQTGALTLAAVTTAAPTYTTGQSNVLSLNTSGGLRVDGSGVTQPISSTSSSSITSYTADGSGNLISSMLINGSRGIETYNVSLDTQSYSAAITGLTVANSATDIFTLTGSATKTIKITRIAFTGTQTTGIQRAVVIIKRSTANSGGTSSSLTAVPHDSNNAAATAVVRAYTANPTLGTTVGPIRTRRVLINTTIANSDELILDFGDRPAQPIVLRGTSEVLSINLNGVTSAGNNLDISIEWTEE